MTDDHERRIRELEAQFFAVQSLLAALGHAIPQDFFETAMEGLHAGADDPRTPDNIRRLMTDAIGIIEDIRGRTERPG